MDATGSYLDPSPGRLAVMMASPNRGGLDVDGALRLTNAMGRLRGTLRYSRLLGVPLWRYAPRSQLRLPATPVARSRFPSIDAHNHLGRWLTGDGSWMVADVPRLVTQMDELGVETVLNLDGRWGDELGENLDRYDRAHPGRFLTLAQLDWSLLSRHPDAGALLADQLREVAAAGAGGLKVWKDLGLEVRDTAGSLVLPDDPRVAQVWALAGELDLTVLIHVADPLAFFAPVDRFNERLEELTAHPQWSLHGRGLPTHARLLQALDTVLAAHPGTRFVAAHVASCAEDLASVSALMDAHPNLAVDLSARQAELGRQPRSAKAFISRYPDRVLWGSDAFPFDPHEVATWFRFLETRDESFAYSAHEVPPQGRWSISALDLPDELLSSVYAQNARRWFPALSR